MSLWCKMYQQYHSVSSISVIQYLKSQNKYGYCVPYFQENTGRFCLEHHKFNSIYGHSYVIWRYIKHQILQILKTPQQTVGSVFISSIWPRYAVFRTNCKGMIRKHVKCHVNTLRATASDRYYTCTK